MTGFIRFMLTWLRLSEAVAVVIVDTLIWMGGVPGPVDLFPSVTPGQRLWLMALVVLLWLAVSYARYRWRRRRAGKLFAGLSGDTTLSPVGTDSALEIEELRQPLADALAYLREQGEEERGRDFANVLPWLLVLGPPGAGCGALVERSDLPMPIEERLGRGGIRTQVAGGTRWWFTDEGLLISPHGAALAVDETGGAAPLWRGLLDFLVERRLRRPVDGVILVVDAERLLRGEGAEIAATLRVRLQEAMRRFGSRLQVYMAVSKADRVAGFAEYFAGIDAETRRDALGVLLPVPEPVGQTRLLAALHAELERLGERLGRDLPFRIAADRDTRRRARAASFPSMFQRLSQAIEAFCAELTRGGRYDTALLLRGVFLTSARSGGDGAAMDGAAVDGAIDAWAPAFAGDLGLAVSTVPAATVGGPLFINGLFRRIAFPEIGLAGSNPRVERRLLLLHAAGYVVCVLALLLSAVLWLDDYERHSEILDGMRTGARTEAAELAPLSGHASFVDIIPALDTARALTNVDLDHVWLNPLRLTEAIDAAQRSYDDLLVALLLPALRRTLEGQLQTAVSAGADAVRVRSLLTTYLELVTPAHYARADIAGWASATLAAQLAGQPQLLADAQTHTGALLDLLPTPLARNDALVEGARALLRTAPTADVIYTELKSVALRSSLPGIDVVASLGPAGAQLLMLRAQARLPTIVPALYTREGFYQIFLPQAPKLARNLGENNWILGHTETSEAQAEQLLHQVSDLYVRDYISQWRVVLDQISLRALPDLGALTAALQTLSGIDSPLVQLVNLVRTQTDLPIPAPASSSLLGKAAGAATAAGVPAGAAASAASAVAGAVASANPLPGVPWPGDAIRTVFAPLQALAEAGPAGQPPVLRIQNTLAGAYGTVAGIDSAKDPGLAAQTLAAQVISGQSTDALLGLRVQAANLPRPVSDVMRELYSSIWSALLQLAAAQLQAVWARDVDSACQQTIGGRYPFAAPDAVSVAPDVALADFTAFFGRGGVMDKFVTTNLALFTQPGQNGDLVLATDDGISLNISRVALEQINRARRIRNLFFGTDGNLSLRFFLQPTYLDPRATTATLAFDKTLIRDRHDPPVSTQVLWPSPDSSGSASFTLVTVGGQTPQIATTGPWAMFRLLSQAQRMPAAPGEQTITFTGAGLRSTWLLRAASVLNPLTTSDTLAFRCVPRL